MNLTPKQLADELWQEFLTLSAIRVFGEKETIGGKKVRDLIGSADVHKKVFDQAVINVYNNFSGGFVDGT